jgi:hypothetical protein
LATFFHIGSYGWWDDALLPVFAGFWLLLNPSSVFRLLLFVTVQLFDVWLHLPDVPNHWLIAAAFDVLVLLSYVRLALERRSIRISGSELIGTFAPPVRIVVIIVYAFTLVHKLNWDFLSPGASCGTVFHSAYARAYPFIPDGLVSQLVSIYASLVIEAAIPLLLLFGCTRGLGVLVGLLFHEILSLNPISGFYNFSAMMIALFLLFAREDFVERLQEAFRSSRLRAWLQRLKDQEFAVWRFVAYALVLAIGLLAASHLFWEFPSRRVFGWLWIPYSAGAILAFAALGDWRMRGDRGVFRVEYSFLLVVPFLIFVNGSSPYLGLKT